MCNCMLKARFSYRKDWCYQMGLRYGKCYIKDYIEEGKIWYPYKKSAEKKPEKKS